MKYTEKVISKLRRAESCWSDNQGASISRDWLDTLVVLGLLERVQRSPALWEFTDEGYALLEENS